MSDFKVTLVEGNVEYTDDDKWESAEDVRRFLADKFNRYPGWASIGHVVFHSTKLISITEHDPIDETETK